MKAFTPVLAFTVIPWVSQVHKKRSLYRRHQQLIQRLRAHHSLVSPRQKAFQGATAYTATTPNYIHQPVQLSLPGNSESERFPRNSTLCSRDSRKRNRPGKRHQPPQTSSLSSKSGKDAFSDISQSISSAGHSAFLA
ncbi:hypothetical protein DPMN_134719 [Dreissena polymorpha]|uniref:Uncharacterized protein n=1 Tax=Dreissena polymorpha TaxID=45954 RepID=A0A9D4G0F3_DREPO|nr:hypothetical protein DPMN_134719 [Dreissena polymorpha]